MYITAPCDAVDRCGTVLWLDGRSAKARAWEARIDVVSQVPYTFRSHAHSVPGLD